MFKRILALALCLMMLLSFTACKIKISKTPDTENTEQTNVGAENNEPENKNETDGEAKPESETENETKPENETENETKPESKTENETKPESETENKPKPEEEKITFEQFLEKAEGMWLLTDSIQEANGEYYYSFCTISKEYYGGGVYPGGGERPGEIEGFEQIKPNVYTLSLYYPATVFMEEELPEDRATVTFTWLGEGNAKIKYEDNAEMTCIYGGKDLPDAQKAAKAFSSK